MEIDHDRRVVHTETLALAGQDRELLLAAAQPTEEQVLSRLPQTLSGFHHCYFLHFVMSSSFVCYLSLLAGR